jgi:glycyl-tRNA synthetase beta subunit
MASEYSITPLFDSDALVNALRDMSYDQMQGKLARKAGRFTDTERFYFRTIHKALHINDAEEAADFTDAWLFSEAIQETASLPGTTARSYALYRLADCMVESLARTGV